MRRFTQSSVAAPDRMSAQDPRTRGALTHWPVFEPEWASFDYSGHSLRHHPFAKGFQPRFCRAGTVKTAAFDKAIRIYCDATGARIKTDASHIVYWAERKRSDFSSKGDYVEVLGLFRDGQVVGLQDRVRLTNNNRWFWQPAKE
jgi:hypothetical protein